METETKNKAMTFQEILKSGHDEVRVLSYGYTERSSFSSHFEPFKNKRCFIFKIDKYFGILTHKWLFFKNEEDEDFYEKDGKLFCDDPDLWARPDY